MAPCLRIALAATVSILPFCAKVQQAAAQQAGGATQLDQINVEGEGAQGARRPGAAEPGGTQGVATSDGYVAKSTRTATKSDLPIQETPATISTVTTRQLEDRRPQNLQEALAYTPGARTGAFGFDPRYDSFSIRGVDITYTGVFRDGLRQGNSPNGLFRLEPYGLEQISILKGPASAIYGASASVGIIDLISKRPTDYKFGEIEAQTGSFDRMQGAFDIGGPVNDEGTVLYRFTGLARKADTEANFVPDDRVFIAPAVTFKPSDDTKLTILSEFMEAKTGGGAAYQNVLSKNDNFSLGAIRKQSAQGDYNDFVQKQARIGYEFQHDFNDALSFRQNVRYSGLNTHQEYNGEQLYSFGLYRDMGLVEERTRAFSADSYLQAKVDTGPVKHTLMAGVDYSRVTYSSAIGFGTWTDATAIPTPDLSIFSSQRQNLVGFYAQDEMKLDEWRLIVGGRYDKFDSVYRENGSANERQDDGKFTGRAALSYVAPSGLTPYVSYGTSFVPNPGTVLNGSVAKPTTGEQAEAGLKYAVPGYNATINGSVFWLKQKDGVIYVVDTAVNTQTQLDFRSRGFELDANASLSNGINLTASYSFTDTEILKLTPLTEGKRLSSIPKHAFAVWAGYDWKSGALNGLGLGAGVRYTGFNYGDELNRPVISNKARAFLDAKASYELGALNPRLQGFKVQVNAENLLDSRKQTCASNYCYYDEGRKVLASLRYRW